MNLWRLSEEEILTTNLETFILAVQKEKTHILLDATYPFTRIPEIYDFKLPDECSSHV